MDLPNAKYDHVYAILRLEKEATGEASIDRSLITVKKVVQSREAAEGEVDRLNRLNAGKGCEYYYQITRLERELRSPEQDVESPL